MLLAYLDNSEQWPEGMDRELIKYYRRTYINPNGPKHSFYLSLRAEWERENGVTYLPDRRSTNG